MTNQPCRNMEKFIDTNMATFAMLCTVGVILTSGVTAIIAANLTIGSSDAGVERVE